MPDGVVSAHGPPQGVVDDADHGPGPIDEALKVATAVPLELDLTAEGVDDDRRQTPAVGLVAPAIPLGIDHRDDVTAFVEGAAPGMARFVGQTDGVACLIVFHLAPMAQRIDRSS